MKLTWNSHWDCPGTRPVPDWFTLVRCQVWKWPVNVIGKINARYCYHKLLLLLVTCHLISIKYKTWNIFDSKNHKIQMKFHKISNNLSDMGYQNKYGFQLWAGSLRQKIKDDSDEDNKTVIHWFSTRILQQNAKG